MDSGDDTAFDDEVDDSNEDEQDLNEEDDQEDHIDVDELGDGDGRRFATRRIVTCPKVCTGESGDYEMLSPDQISVFMNDVVKDVNQIIQQPPTTTRLLLSQYKWDKEKLIEKYYEDTEKLFSSCQVLQLAERKHSGRNKASSVECDICFLGMKSKEFKGTDCGHRFCCDCWKEYLTNKIIHENVTDKIECPAHKCKILLDDVFVMDMIGHQPTVKRKYLHGITNSFVLAHRSIQWCPGTDCLYAIKVASPEWMSITCTKCHTAFCFLCAEPWHDPVQCGIYKRWKKKCMDDSETCNWLVANTKECPSCHATIEKDGGCNYVACRNVACGKAFCWVCLGLWATHNDHWTCNRYNEEESKANRTAAEKARELLKRYHFFFNRFANHQNSLKLETTLKDKVKAGMEQMELKHNITFIEVGFLPKAVAVLHRCRQTLMYTYVFAFFLKKNNLQVLFEDNQSDLEMATETLSRYLEHELNCQDPLADIKRKVQDKANYCESRRQVLVEHVHEGYENDWWELD